MSFARQSVFVLLLLLPAAQAARAEKVEALKPQGYVNDFAGVVDTLARERIAALCKEVDEKTHAQIAVVTIRSLEGMPIEEFSIQLATRWGVGHKGDNRGVLILLATTDRKYRIEVGYGLEPILPDGKVGGFGREMVPMLRQNDYGGALYYLTWRIADVIARDRGTTLASPTPRGPPQPAAEPSGSDRGPDALVITLVAIYILVRIFGFGVIWPMVYATFAVPYATFMATGAWVFGGPERRHRGWWGLWLEVWHRWHRYWRPRGRRSSGWFGGMFGGGGGGGGSFGGFGGGSFGGGGASGSW